VTDPSVLREEQGGNGMNGNSEPKLGGYEYVLFLGIVMFAIALRGGGPYSVDRLIGREL
jgi:uncharacterized membrane protein YphA (DoxX/SURF4 family)